MYRAGAHYVICDICAGRLLNTEAKKNWEGLLVHPRCWDPRHPQELIRARKDKISVKDSRPEGQDVFLNPGDVTRDDL